MPSIDRSFMKDLKSLDRKLSAKFNGEHVVITYDRGHGEPVNILRIRGEDGGFKQPDRRDLMIIKGGDLAEGPKMDTRLREAAYRSERQQEDAKRKAAAEIRAMTLDGKNQLVKAYTQKFNLSKGNATFRRIAHKPGKNTVATA
jgi:hypothetical protein